MANRDSSTPRSPRQPRRFDNLSDAEVADQYGEACEARTQCGPLRAEILFRDADLDGERFHVTIRTRQLTGFDHQRCRELLGEDVYRSLWVQSPSPFVVAKRKVNGSLPRAPADPAFANRGGRE